MASKLSTKSLTHQSHGLRSKVYAPVLLHVFRARWRQGAAAVVFTLDDIRNALESLRLESRNPADVIYRMRSRTVLPQEIRDKGFLILRAIGRGTYQFEKGGTTVVSWPTVDATEVADSTPLPVRRLLPEFVADMDEQAVLTIASYCRIVDRFTGLRMYRLRNHLRKSVPGVGQAELDAIDVGVAHDENELPVIFPIEVKAAADALNRVQIQNMIAYCEHYFRDLQVRPLAIKIDYESNLHVMEFALVKRASELRVLKNAAYRLILSDSQRAAIEETSRGKNAPGRY